MGTIRRRQMLGFGVAAAVALSTAPGVTTPSGVRAEESGSIAGRVIDASGAPVAGAPVTVSSALLPDGELSVVADAGGGFSLGSLDAGFYDVSVETAGFRRGQFRDVQVGAGRNTRIDLTLESRGEADGGY